MKLTLVIGNAARSNQILQKMCISNNAKPLVLVLLVVTVVT